LLCIDCALRDYLRVYLPIFQSVVYGVDIVVIAGCWYFCAIEQFRTPMTKPPLAHYALFLLLCLNAWALLPVSRNFEYGLKLVILLTILDSLLLLTPW